MEEKQGRSWRNPGFAQTGAHPAVCLSWNDAQGLCGVAVAQDRQELPSVDRGGMGICRARREHDPVFFGDDEKDCAGT